MTFMDPARVLQLAMIASRLSGYELPHDVQPPTVMELSSVEMHRASCGVGVLPNDPCYNDIGLYTDGGSIQVDVQYSSTHAFLPEDVLVVHELTHWLQYIHAWGGSQCPHARAREQEAYRISNRYLKEYLHSKYQQEMPDVCLVSVTIIPETR